MQEIYEALTVADVQRAADVWAKLSRPVAPRSYCLVGGRE